MDWLIKILQVIGPLITVSLAVFGLYVWYHQLVAKRKFEIAEQAITVFKRAVDGLAHVRNPFVRGGEGESVELDAGFTGLRKENAERHRYIFERMNNITDAFKEVRVTQLLVELHIDPDAARAFDVLFRLRHLIRVDAEALIDDFIEYDSDPTRIKECNERRAEYRRGITERRDKDGKPYKDDKYSAVLDEATAAVDKVCRQILRPKTLNEFLFVRTPKAAPHVWSDEAKKVLGIR